MSLKTYYKGYSEATQSKYNGSSEPPSFIDFRELIPSIILEGGVDWIFGVHAVQSVLKSAPERVEELVLQSGRQDDRLKKIQRLAELHGVTVQLASLKNISAKVTGRHQGVIARCAEGPTHDEHFLYALAKKSAQKGFFLMLDGVTDPHNLGACLRSAACAGVDAVIVPKDNSVGLTPTVQKVASGAAEVIPLVVVTNLSRTLVNLQELGVWVIGMAGDASASLYDLDVRGASLLVMGSEDTGLRDLTKKHCDFLAKIPMTGDIESLNVSVAAGVAMFEVVRQRAL